MRGSHEVELGLRQAKACLPLEREIKMKCESVFCVLDHSEKLMKAMNSFPRETYKYTLVCMYIYIYMYIYTLHTHTDTYTHTHRHKHTHIYSILFVVSELS